MEIKVNYMPVIALNLLNPALNKVDIQVFETLFVIRDGGGGWGGWVEIKTRPVLIIYMQKHSIKLFSSGFDCKA